MSKIQTVWVYADAAERYADLIAGARRFGAVVNAVVPCESCAAELRACGPAAVYNLGLAEGEAIENYAETIASLAQGEGNLFLFDATRRSKALAAGVAAKRGAGLVNDALSLEAGDAVKATFRTYGGLAAAAVRIVSADAVVTVGAGVFEPEPAERRPTSLSLRSRRSLRRLRSSLRNAVRRLPRALTSRRPSASSASAAALPSRKTLR